MSITIIIEHTNDAMPTVRKEIINSFVECKLSAILI